MKTTYACLCPSQRRIELRTRDLEPVADQVLVRIAACGICRGDLTEFMRIRDTTDAFGHEPFGQVVAVGPWCKCLHEGDWVVGSLGSGFATHGVGREADLLVVPESLGEAGALAEPLKCVTTVVRAAQPDFGDSVVIIGCGFMGLAAISALAGGWQKQIIAIDTAAERRQRAIEWGATTAIDPAAADAVAEVRRLTGRGADAAIDFAGNTQAATLAARVLRQRGRLVLAGGYIPQDTGIAIYLGAITTHYAPPMFSPDPADDWRRAVEAMVRGRFPLQRFISHRFGLSQIQGAFDAACQGLGGAYMKGIILNDLAEA